MDCFDNYVVSIPNNKRSTKEKRTLGVSKPKQKKINVYFKNKNEKKRRSSSKQSWNDDDKITSLHIIQKENDEFEKIEREIDHAFYRAYNETIEMWKLEFPEKCACCGHDICDFASELFDKRVNQQLKKNKFR